MSWIGKILGGGLGMVLGGPLGALLGAGLGHVVLDKTPQVETGASASEARQVAFFTTTFAMLGKMAKADGRVSEEEISVVERFIQGHLRLDGDARRLAISLFNQAKSDDTPFTAYATQFGDLFAHDEAVRNLLYQVLFSVAAADGTIHPAEEKLLRDAIGPLRLDENAFDRLGTIRRPVEDVAQHYDTLGLSPDCTDEDVKRTYRKLCRQYHPDTVVAQGLPEEFARIAEEKLKEINVAHEAILAHRAART